MESNEELLKDIPVDMNLYGKFNLVGVHDDEPNPVPNAYNKWRKYHFYDSDKFLINWEIDYIKEEQRKYKTRLREVLPEPKTLYELAEFASK